MPDQSSAADEHALIEEITAPLADLPDNPVPIAADPEFPMVLRGYDRVAVDAYVRRTSQLVAELQATRSPEAAVRRALERVGEQISGILQRAHDTAAQITTQSRSEAEDRLEVARREAQQITTAAEGRVRELDAETDRIWAERQRIVEDARQLAQELMSLADSAAARFPAASGDTTDAPFEVGQVAAGSDLPEDTAPGPGAGSVEVDGSLAGDAVIGADATTPADGPPASHGVFDGDADQLPPEEDRAATLRMPSLDAVDEEPPVSAARPDELEDATRPPDPAADH